MPEPCRSPSPAARPTTSSQSGPPESGTKHDRQGSKRTAPPIARHSPRFGFHPPETARSSVRSVLRSPRSSDKTMASSCSSPQVPSTCPAAGPPMIEIIAPACPRTFIGMCQPSVHEKMLISEPGRTPKRSTNAAAAEASITPGRSFPANAIGRSVAPVARITRPARTCQRRSIVAERSCATT